MQRFQRLAIMVSGFGMFGAVLLNSAPAPQTKPGGVSAPSPAAGSLAGPRHRLLWDRGEFQGTISADGQWLSFPNWHTGDLGVRNLKTGESRLVTNRGGYWKAHGKTEANTLSPDGRWVAYKWERWDAGAATEGKYNIRVVGADGKDDRVVLSGKDILVADPRSWSPDSRSLAATAMYKDGTGHKIEVLIAPLDGTPPRVVLTLDRLPRSVLFSPDGKWLAFDASAPGGPWIASMDRTRQQHIYVIAADGSSREPADVVSDAHVMAWTPDGTALLFRREHNSLMELYAQPVSNGRAAGDARKIHGVTDVGFPMGITAAGALIHGTWKPSASVIFASIDPATGAIGPFAGERPVASVGAGGLGGGVRYSPDGRQVLYVTTAKSLLIRSLVDGTERTLASPMTTTERIEWAHDSGSLLISGTPAGGKHAVYRVDLQSGAATLLIDVPAFWLASSPDGRVIYYVTETDGTAVQARDLRTGASRTVAKVEGYEAWVVDLKVSRDGRMLAAIAPFAITLVNLETGVATARYTQVEGAYEKFWGVEWSADGRHLLLSVSGSASPFGPKAIWSLPVAGGPPLRQEVPWGTRGLSLSRDGTQLATMQVTTTQQVWAVDNFWPMPARNR